MEKRWKTENVLSFLLVFHVLCIFEGRWSMKGQIVLHCVFSMWFWKRMFFDWNVDFKWETFNNLGNSVPWLLLVDLMPHFFFFNRKLIHLLTHLSEALHQARLKLIVVIPPAVVPGYVSCFQRQSKPIHILNFLKVFRLTIVESPAYTLLETWNQTYRRKMLD